MLKIGLTGGIASGKTSVASWFEARGVRIFDADSTVHRLYEHEDIVTLIGKEFGDLYTLDGQVDRTQLGRLAFNNEEAKDKLEKIIHPYVRDEMNNSVEKAAEAGEQVIILDLPLLFETGWTSYVDEIWVVYVSPEIQILRLMDRNNFTREEALLRISSQLSLEYKAENSDRVINNSGDWTQTELELLKIWGEITTNTNLEI